MFKRLFSLVTLLVIVVAAFPFSGGIKAQEIAPETNAAPNGATGRQQISAQASALKANGAVSYAEPSDSLVYRLVSAKLGPKATSAEIEAASNEYLANWAKTAYHGPDPKAYERLLKNEQRALAADSSPAALGLGITGTLRLFTVAVEFAGTDSLAGFTHPVSVDDRTCVTEPAGATASGPLHNAIPAPGPRDNITPWVADYNKQYLQNIVLSTTGITERLRPDLTDPEDGLPGINVSGASMRNYYEEVSGGNVQFDVGPGGVIAWITVPHSEAYYGATACLPGENDGDQTEARIQAMDGLPGNTRGAGQLLVDIVDKINATTPNFPWDQYDLDGDNVIDHVVVFHAGKDKSSGGGLQEYQALWAHRGTVDAAQNGYLADDGGTPGDTSDDVRLAGYTMQYEDVGTGVLVHEFGHDLGLPDLYDVQSGGESSVVWWDLMSTGSHTGKLFDMQPTHMSAWSKFALGWADIQAINPTLSGQNVKLGQTSNPPAGTEQAIRVNLPNLQNVDTQLLPGSTQAWWSNNDANWADVRLTHDVNLTGQTAPISISFDLDAVVEADWDYLFLEVSVDGGATYTQTQGFEVGTNAELTTPLNYADPNHRLADYGNLRFGYTGDTGGWLRAYHNLSAYAGQNIKVRFRYATDAGFTERGAYVDNIKVTAGNTVILNDPVENNNLNGWVPLATRFVSGEPLSAGWEMSDGVREFPLYYLAEWRNINGFDEGLLYTYNTIFSIINLNTGVEEWKVDRVASNIPGMVVYVRDTRFGSEPFGADNSILNYGNQFNVGPSEGPKGGLLVVDANYMPLRGPRGGVLTTGVGTFPFPPSNNWGGRVQTTNSAFNLQGTRPATLTVASNVDVPASTVYTPTSYPVMPGVTAFDDSLSYYPGVEELAVPIQYSPTRSRKYAFSDSDASVVIPARGYYPPRTPAGFTGLASDGTVNESILPLGSQGTFVYNVGSLVGGFTNLTGQQSGNPRDYGVQHGVKIQILSQQQDGSYATIRVTKSVGRAFLPAVRR